MRRYRLRWVDRLPTAPSATRSPPDRRPLLQGVRDIGKGWESWRRRERPLVSSRGGGNTESRFFTPVRERWTSSPDGGDATAPDWRTDHPIELLCGRRSIDRFPENRPQFVVYLLILLGPGTPGMMLGAAPPESGPLCVKYVPAIV